MQIKVIFSVLLREYEFEMAQPAGAYRNDQLEIVVQLGPARQGSVPQAHSRGLPWPIESKWTWTCQGHAMCRLETTRSHCAQTRHRSRSSMPNHQKRIGAGRTVVWACPTQALSIVEKQDFGKVTTMPSLPREDLDKWVERSA